MDMNKIAIKLIIVLSISLIISSCDPILDSYNKIYLTNETDFSYLAHVHYPHFNDSDTTCLVQTHAVDQFIDSHVVYGAIDRSSHAMDIWLICLYDSSFVLLSNYSSEIDGESYFKQFVEYNYVDQSTRKNRSTNLTFSITINDSLRSVMTKNTELADSLFNLLN